MTKELEDKLYKKYPKIFKQHSLPMTETCMCWGLPGDGWFKIIDTVCKKIQAWCDANKAQIEFTQVKEKYGTLRIYTNVGNDKIYAMISKAEEDSSKTCEKCGEKGTINRGPWYSVRCKACRAEENK